MACLYKRPRSPFWYLGYYDESGKLVCRSTGLRHEDRHQTAQAKVLKAKLEVETLSPTKGMAAAGWIWVDAFLVRHSPTETTLNRYRNGWSWVAYFFGDRKIDRPDQVAYRHGAEYIEWRTTYRKRPKAKLVGRNTALLDLRVLRIVMREAVRLGHCPSNPVTELRIPKTPAKEKAELTEQDFKDIRTALKDEPEWMRDSFEISAHTGCRLRDTIIPLSKVDLEQGTILFAEPKGGKGKAFTAPLPKALRPLFLKMKKEKQTATLEMPFQPSREWRRLFDRIEKPHLTFHCLRVTYVTRLARAGVPLSAAMRLVNHSSEVVHRVYQRLGVEDVRQYADQALIPTAADATG